MADHDLTAADLKKCSRCGIEKPRPEFYKCAACKDGLRGECKRCVAAKQSVYNEKNADKISAQKRRYRSENLESIQEAKRAYYLRNSDRIKEKTRRRELEKPDEVREAHRAYRRKNAASIAERMRLYWQQNSSKFREKKKRYYQENKSRLQPGRKAAKARRRNAAGSVVKADVVWLLEMQRWKCAVCAHSIKKGGYHLDHIMPLARGGTNHRENLQVLCPACNLSKSAKHPVDFMQQRGLLL